MSKVLVVWKLPEPYQVTNHRTLPHGTVYGPKNNVHFLVGYSTTTHAFLHLRTGTLYFGVVLLLVARCNYRITIPILRTFLSFNGSSKYFLFWPNYQLLIQIISISKFYLLYPPTRLLTLGTVGGL